MRRYIPIKIKSIEEDYIICDGIMNYKPYTKYRKIKNVEIGIIKIGKDVLKNKNIYIKHYVLILKDGKYKRSKDTNIIKWGKWLFDEYEKTLNGIYKGKFENNFINDL